ncbi:bicaudal-D-related protein 2-like [Pseudoliparis swirei]|uniref:bicaudal-D-related protein 2-like n=1 Tax=Pseudoliparis swirei TaxID=2059687 RepID=UPI0024BE8ACE|nr:bicaudal-D-related protein 2-like [Pseudoliparis swirei]
MDHTQSFSSLNSRLRPRVTSNEKISSLNKLDDGRGASLGRQRLHRTTFLPTEPEPKASESEPEGVTQKREESVGDEDNCADRINNTVFITKLKDSGEEAVEDNRSASSSEEKDNPGELTSERSGHSSQGKASDGEGGSPFETGLMNGTLPDLLNGGKLLSRRRTVGHVSETLKEVRREVELSRRRSIRLKAQVDKLQGSKDGPGWSKSRERVKDEVLSILRLLHPLTEAGSGMSPQPSPEDQHLDTSLAQLQNVARELAISHTKQFKSGKGKGEESAVLQQALRDRDDAIEKKRRMEAELLRSKTEMMLLNNQLLEAVQKRLALSLELEAWKDDVQRILQQQLQSQQQAELAQKKPSRLGILRRNIKPPIQRPTNFPWLQPVSPVTNPKQIFIPRAAVPVAAPASPKLNWRDKRRRPKRSESPDPGQNAAGQAAAAGGQKDGAVFQVISLD